MDHFFLSIHKSNASFHKRFISIKPSLYYALQSYQNIYIYYALRSTLFNHQSEKKKKGKKMLYDFPRLWHALANT